VSQTPTAAGRRATLRRAETRNAVLLTLQGMATALAGPMMPAALAPAILVRLGGSDLVIGLLGTVASAVGVPAMLLAAHLSGQSRRKGLATLLWNSASALVYLPLVLLLAVEGTSTTLGVFSAMLLAATAASGLTGSVSSVLQVDLLSRITVPERRGRVTGVAGSVAGLASLAGGVGLSLLLARRPFPAGYTLACAIGLSVSAAGYLAYLLFRELPGLKTTAAARLPGLRESLQTIRRDRVFLWVLVAAMAKFAGNAGYTFVVPTALRRDGLPDTFVGHFAVVTAVVGIGLGPLQGWLADRWGISRTALLGGAATAAGMVLFARAGSYTAVLACVAVLAVGASALNTMFFLAPLSLSPPEHRSAYIAMRYLAESVAGVVCMPAVGYALTRWDAAYVFWLSGAAALVSAVVLVRATGWYCRRR
jgi:predicted MFS family arabinose efflux permease